jgi:hypothetical protein|tara:strand:- start:1914 stop:2174 length:261 start_codon:yes stop_codon:yes gene_type:complete
VNKILLSVAIICAIIAFQSCDERERTVLSGEEKSMLDSLYAKRVSGVRKNADSICKAQYQLMFNSAKDSFYQSYVREIEAILNGEG